MKLIKQKILKLKKKIENWFERKKRKKEDRNVLLFCINKKRTKKKQKTNKNHINVFSEKHPDICVYH